MPGGVNLNHVTRFWGVGVWHMSLEKVSCRVAVLGAILLAGCSLRPSTEDVTGLPVFDIVQRIQCEAACAVRKIYTERGFNRELAELAQLDEEIKQVDGDVKAQQARLLETSDFGTREEEILMLGDFFK